MTLQIGKPNYTQPQATQFEKMVFHKLGIKDGQRILVVRIAPPIGAMAEKGIWSRYIKQHFGYSVRVQDGKGGERNVPVTFLCVEKMDYNGNVIVKCAECELVRKNKEALVEKEAALKKDGKNEEEIEAILKSKRMWLKEHNLDKKWNMIAKDLQGRWGYLTLSNTCYRLLKGKKEEPGLIESLLAKNIDPLAAENGIWFRFTRNGTNFNEIRDIPSVEKVEVSYEGQMLEKNKTDTLTESDLAALEKLPGLETLGRVVTSEQVQMLVDSGGEEAVVRSIMNIPRPSQGGKPPVVDAPDEPEVTTKPAAKATPAPASSPAVPEKLQSQMAATDVESFLAKFK